MKWLTASADFHRAQERLAAWKFIRSIWGRRLEFFGLSSLLVAALLIFIRLWIGR